DGITTFGLPDMRSRTPIHQGTGQGLPAYTIGEVTGTENVTLTSSNMPQHNHGLVEANAKAVVLARSDAANVAVPNGAFVGGFNMYVTGQATANAALNAASMKFGAGAVTEISGGNQPFSRLQPLLCINFIIALEGIFPSRN